MSDLNELFTEEQSGWLKSHGVLTTEALCGALIASDPDFREELLEILCFSEEQKSATFIALKDFENNLGDIPLPERFGLIVEVND